MTSRRALVTGATTVVAAALVAAAAVVVLAVDGETPAHATAPGVEVELPPDFWSTWGDGRAEIATYRGTRSRYGETRDTTVVAIFVTEDFSATKRVKADPGRNPPHDVFPVLKLNLVEDFTTGIYDYHLMTSAFVSLASAAGVARGTPAKVAFSAQEWCGTAYHQLLFDGRRARESAHSYFDGEADRLALLDVPDDAFVEDLVLPWARGLAAPALAPGETRPVSFLPSLAHARLEHVPLAFTRATLVVAAAATTLTVPAGTFEVRWREVHVDDGRRIRVAVEEAAPHRVVELVHGEHRVSLVHVERTPYWREHGNADRGRRHDLGLE